MQRKVSRRNFVAGAAAFGAAMASAASGQQQAVNVAFSSKFQAPDKSFMDQYYDGMLEIVKEIRSTQVGNIAKTMEKAYELKQKGGKIYCHILTGHLAMFTGSPDQPGQPNVLPNRVDRKTREDVAAMKKGDFLLTNGGGGQAARDKGAFVAGITNNYVLTAKTPEGFLRSENTVKFEDTCDLAIDGCVPYYNGLVNAPQLPQFRPIPSSGNAMNLIYWASTASLANLIGTKGKGSSTEPVEKYLDLAIERMQMIGTDRPKVDWVAEKWADLVLGEKARFLVYGHPQQVATYGGTRNIFTNEAYIVASGTMIADLYELKANEMRRNDILLIGALNSDNADEIRVAHHGKSTGAYTVAFCPYATDGDSSGTRLFKEVDDAFNTYCDESEGVIAVPGFPKKVSSLTGFTGNVVHWLLMAQWTEHMARRGEFPYFYQGFHERQGQAYDAAAKPYFEKRGY
ncbi:MAG: twin-arginine translocation signal domain-containing protein [Candidatus Latescibacterota bacterium]